MAVVVPSRCSALSPPLGQSVPSFSPAPHHFQSSSLVFLNTGSSATHRQIVVSTTVVHTKFPFVFRVFSVVNLSVLLAHGSPTPYLPAIHPVCSSACLHASSPTCLVSILACPPPVVPYCSRPHYNKPVV